MKASRSIAIVPAGARPLYITVAATVSLDSKVSLRITEPSSPALRRIPLRKLSRIVSSNAVTWETPALIECLSRGIPVEFVDRKGAQLGWCFGPRRREATLSQLLALALESEDWKELYPVWFESQGRGHAAQALLLCGLPSKHLGMQDARNRLCNAFTRRHQRPSSQYLTSLEACMTSEVAALMSRQIDDAALLAHYRPGCNLITDFSQLISLHAHVILYGQKTFPAGEELNDRDLRHWAIKIMESNAPFSAQQLGALLGSFELFLREHWL